MSTEDTEAVEAPGEPSPAPTMGSRSARHERPRREQRPGGRRRPGPLLVFAIAFLLLLAAAVCVLIGNIKANSTLLPVISLYLSAGAVVLTLLALFMPAKAVPAKGASLEASPEQ